jgi:5-enolpyruvylshikimate-3-phosphate synthase
MSVSSIEVQPLKKPLDIVVTVPGSKSYTSRALLVAALTEGESVLSGALFSDDTDQYGPVVAQARRRDRGG